MSYLFRSRGVVSQQRVGSRVSTDDFGHQRREILRPLSTAQSKVHVHFEENCKNHHCGTYRAFTDFVTSNHTLNESDVILKNAAS